MFVLLTHIAVIVCFIYAMQVNKAAQVDLRTDGQMGSRETETERGDNSHWSTFMAKQMEKWRWKGDDRDKICVHISRLHSHRVTHHMYSTCTLWHLFVRSHKCAQTGRQMERKGGECADCCVHAAAAVSLH